MQKHLFTIALLVCTLNLLAQGGVAINSTGNTPDVSAMLDITSNSSGLLIPRMTQADRDLITNPKTSLLIYQTDQDSGFYYYDQSTTSWYPFLSGSNTANGGWAIKGNSGTNPSSNFIGTTDSVDWVIRTNNNEKMRVTGNGNVGIGITTPGNALHVNGDFTIGDTTNRDLWSYGINLPLSVIQPQSYNIAMAYNFYRRASDSKAITLGGTDAFAIRMGDFVSPGAGGAIGFFADASVPAKGGELVGGDATLRMVINASGNVGIGTSVPQHNLHIYDDDAATVLSIGEHSNSTKDSAGFSIAPWSDGSVYIDTKLRTGGKLIYRYGEGAVSGTGTTWMTMEDGNMGIGISPTNRVHVHEASSAACNIQFTNTTTGSASATVGGRVGIGSDEDLYVYNGTTGEALRLGTENTTRVYIKNDGNVGIGTTTPSHKLHVTGIARSTQTTWAISSDKRVKTKIADLEDGLDIVMKIRPVEFEYTKKYQKFNIGYNGLKRGFIAQEVKEVVPEMVTILEEKIGDHIIKDFHLLNSSDFTPILIRAIQEQQQLIEQQNQKIDKQTVFIKEQNDINKELKADIKEIKSILQQSSKK